MEISDLPRVMGSLPESLLNVPVRELDLNKEVFEVLEEHDVERLENLLELRPEAPFQSSQEQERAYRLLQVQNQVLTHLMGITTSQTVSLAVSSEPETALKAKEEPADYLVELVLDVPLEQSDVGEVTVGNLKEAGCRWFEDIRSWEQDHYTRIDGLGPTRAKDFMREVSRLEAQAEVLNETLSEIWSDLEALSDGVKESPVGLLPFGCFGEADVEVVDDLLAAPKGLLLSMFLGDTPFDGDVRKITDDLREHIRQLGSVSTMREYWERHLPEYLEQYVGQLDARRFKVLDHRCGLVQSERKTLAEIGDTLGEDGVSRERVRQLENSGLEELSEPLCGPGLEPVKLRLMETIEQEDHLIGAESFEVRFAGKTWGRFRVTGLVKLMQKVDRLPMIKLDEMPVLFSEELDAVIVRDALDELSSMVEDGPVPKRDLIGRGRRWLREESGRGDLPWASIVRTLLTLHPNLGETPFGNVGPLDWPSVEPSTIDEWAYTVLEHHGKPMKRKKISQIVKAHRTKDFRQRSLYGALSRDERFVRFDSGTYGLEEMKEDFSLEGVKPVVTHVYEVLLEHGSLSGEAVVERVQDRKDCTKSSVLTYLKEDPRVVSEDGRYRLRDDHEELGRFSTGRGTWGGQSPKYWVQQAKPYLKEKEAPVHIDEISYQVSKRGDQPVHNLLLGAYFRASDEVVSMGRRHWALAEHGYREFSTEEALKTCLREADRPMTASELLDAVQTYRKMAESTVYNHLNEDECFQPTNDGRYQLEE